MRIRTKITLLTTALTAAVVAGVTANLLWVERRRVDDEALSRVQTLMEGVVRLGREAVAAKDELMLLSYLKHLQREYPEIEVATVSREGYASVIGEVRSPLMYRTIAVSSARASAFQAGGARPASPPEAAPWTFTIQLGFSKAALERQAREARLGLLRKTALIAAAGLLLGALGSLWLGGLLSRPVLALAEAAGSIGAGRLDARVPAGGKDELADLGRRFNDMGGKLAELISSKEELMSTLSHEMRTPLTGLKGFLEYLQDPAREHAPAERQEAYTTMLEAVSQLDLSLTNALQLFRSGARPAVEAAPVAVDEVVREVIRLFTPAAQSNGVKLAARLPAGPVVIEGDRELVRRVVVNLVANAILYTPSGGSVGVFLRPDGDAAALAVSDNGPGIAPGDREKIFERFYRAAGPGGRPRRIPGSGLGLAITKQAVDLHRGRVWVESEVGKGSVFHVRLPKTRGAS